MERHQDWEKYQHILYAAGLSDNISLMHIYADSKQTLIDQLQQKMEERDERNEKLNQKWNEDFYPIQYGLPLSRLQQGTLPIHFIGEGYYDLWENKHRYQVLRIDQILEKKVGYLEVFDDPDAVKQSLYQELGSERVYCVYSSYSLCCVAGAKEELTESRLFQALRWNGLDLLSILAWEAPELREIPRYDIKQLKELTEAELYSLIKQKNEEELKMIPAEKMNPIYGFLTAEEAEEKWGLEPGTITKRCETDWKDKVRQSQNTWLIPYDTVLKAYGYQAITRRINERKRKKAGKK